MAYNSSKILDLKKEALISRDIQVLKNIREYEEREHAKVIYYTIEGEGVVRDSNGLVIDSKLMHLSVVEKLEHFWSIGFTKSLQNAKNRPGRLFDLIQDTPDYLNSKIVIMEVPVNTKFPIQKDIETLYRQCQPHSHSHRLNGLEFICIQVETEGELPKPDLIMLSLSSMTDEEIREYEESLNNL